MAMHEVPVPRQLEAEKEGSKWFVMDIIHGLND